MKKLTIHLNNLPTNKTIFIGSRILPKIGNLFGFSKFSKVIIITDTVVAPLFLKKLSNTIPIETNSIVLPVGEKVKNISTVQDVWKKLVEFHCDRKTLIINLGGGVICDIGGFAATTFMRGLNFLNIPTTLLSQTDAAIGGKNGINFLGIKNLIGTIQQPIGIVIDIQNLKTLPKREFISGFAETIKHGLIRDKKYFSFTTSKSPLQFNSRELIHIIFRSIQIKADIISKDTTEKDVRKLLNFGHTIGHAIEAISLDINNPISHGEAVIIGMLIESKISFLKGLLPFNELKIIEHALQKFSLANSINILDFDLIIKKIINDKKNLAGETNWTLLKNIGEGLINQKIDNSIVKKVISDNLL